MAEILKEWLTERLQYPVTWEPEQFGEMMKNGHIIAGVLLSYHAINEEKHFLIRPSKLRDDIKNNWAHLVEWLKELDIHLSATELANVITGKGSSLLRLFYQLFLHLDRRDRTDFIKRERKMVSTLVDKVGHRFKVDTLEEEKESVVDDLARPLLNERHFIEWQKKKTAEIKSTYDYVRHKYSKMLEKITEKATPLKAGGPIPKELTNKDKNDMDNFCNRYPCKYNSFTYDELLKLNESYDERKKSILDTEFASKYMDNLHKKLNNKADSEEFQKQISNAVSASLWDLSVAEEESKSDIGIAKKVMKLSQFEKQMCTQIMETKQQARNLAENRIAGEREFTEQRTMQFNQFLDNVKELIHLELDEIDFEKRRQNKLHEKLYAEKMKRKRQHYYEICYETMLSIVDYATRYAYFMRLIGDDIPDHFIHEWKSLYFKHQPIFDIYEPVEEILVETNLEEEQLPEIEEIIRLELERQDALNDSEFNDYHNYSYPWTLDLLIPNYDHESEERKFEYLGTRVLGHVVYTLLEIKYPYVPQRLPAAIPCYPVKSLLRGLPERSITVPMQGLLKHRNIAVVRLETAINFCLRKFKTEMIGCTDIDLSFDKFVLATTDEEQKELIKQVKAEDEMTNKSIDMQISAMLGVTPPNTKQTQTPKSLPEDEIILSTAADLGKYTYEALSFGDSLTDHLLSAMLVEYIKDLDDINGFVVINYPNCYREASILEETFSGIEPPNEGDLEDRDEIYLEESIAKHRKKEKDPYKTVRLSRLVNDPHKKTIVKPFESYFTSYINLKETEDILQELVIWDLDEENSTLLDRFYAALGINYSMYYEYFDKDLLSQLCTYILGEVTIPMKTTDSLFGLNVLSMLEFPPSDDKRIKSKVIKPEVPNNKSKDKLRRGSQTQNSKLSAIELDEVKKSAIYEEVTGEEVDHLAAVQEDDEKSEDEEPEPLLAGEEDWDYGVIPISEPIGIALATCWEQIEKTYITDMQQLFFAIRLQMNCLIPYARFITDKMTQIITLPSQKQDLVCRFQQEYNDFENDWRDVYLTKNEWHCRVKELQLSLYKICDERKLFAEKERLNIIRENWAMEELTTMVNSYISCMQTELNRSTLTYQILHDFYFAMIKKLPPNDRLFSKELTKISRDGDDSTRRDKDDKVYKQLKSAFQNLQLKNIEIDFSNNPFNYVIDNNVKYALKVISEMNDTYRAIINREHSDIAKISIPVKKKEEGSSLDSIPVEAIFKENAFKCLEEWTMGVQGEMFRAGLRIVALQYKCWHDMRLFNDHIYKTLMKIQNYINTYYMNEIKSVDRLCKYLQMAVENGRRIPESLILEHDTFVIDPNLLQFAPPEKPVDTGEVLETANTNEFKISQLARLRDQLKIVASGGLVLQQSFIYILQDFLFFGKESCTGSLFPETWLRLDPMQVPKLVFVLFGETAYIDWRDFLIMCLNLRPPTDDELLDMRRYCRCSDLESTELISRDDFINIEFWFEPDFDFTNKHAMLRKHLIKHFLAELYEVSEDVINYSAFLIALCRDEDPIKGFVTALSMAVGKKICYSFIECENVVCNLIKYKKYKDECLACAHKCTKIFLDKVMTNVINTCEGVMIEEMEYEAVAVEDKKKKGKDKGKKKGESIQSARSSKFTKTSLMKTQSLSEPNIKTYICPPCEVEEVPAESEKELVEEEQLIEHPKPDLVYSVSQAVIWNVLKTCLPWHFLLMPEHESSPYIDRVTEAFRRLEEDTDNGDIYVCRLVLDPEICQILHKVKKFTDLSLDEEVSKLFI